MAFLGANGETVASPNTVPRSDAAGGWVDGGSNPFLGAGPAGEDPVKTAAKEMQATIAAGAMQKAQMASAGLGALVGGGVPSAASISNWKQTGRTPEAIANPYAHLSRDEKIALIGELQKSKSAREAASHQPAPEDAPSDLIDPLEELSKGGSTMMSPPMEPKKPAVVAERSPTADRAPKEAVEKGGPPAAPMSSTHLKKPEKDPIETKEEKKMLGNDRAEMRKAEINAFDDLLKSAEGEGSKGGKVIGHTASGKPIYAPTQGHIEVMRENVNLQKRTAKGKLAEHAAGHVHHSAQGYTPEDHKHAAEAHAKESRDYKNSDKVRAFHGAISEAHGALAAGKPTPAASEAKRLDDAAFAAAAAAGKKEAARKKDVVATAPGGHKIMNTHHVRGGGIGGPEGPLEGGAKGQGGSFGLRHPPIETEAGAHLTHDQHKDIAAYHHEQAHHHAVLSSTHSSISERINHRTTKEQHEHAAKYHEDEAAKKKPAENPNQGKLFEKAGNSMSKHESLTQMAAFANGDVLHKNVDHPRPGAEATPMTGFESGKKKAPDQSVKKPELVNHDNPSLELPEGAEDDDSTPGMKSAEMVDHPREGGAMKKGGLDALEDFVKSAMPEGVPSGLPSSHVEANGGELDGVGAPEGAQDTGEQTAASTSHLDGSGEDANLRELSKRYGAPGAGEEDLESSAGGQKLQKGWVDWDQAADDGEYLRAQLASQLMNKSLDVTVGLGVKSSRQAPVQPEPKMPSVYFQKGGLGTVYVDSEDRMIEKSMERVSGTTFTQGSQLNIGAPIQHETECGGCGTLVKSFLYSCTACGLPLNKSAPSGEQGMRIAKSVAMSLVPSDEDEISIG